MMKVWTALALLLAGTWCLASETGKGDPLYDSLTQPRAELKCEPLGPGKVRLIVRGKADHEVVARLTDGKLGVYSLVLEDETLAEKPQVLMEALRLNGSFSLAHLAYVNGAIYALAGHDSFEDIRDRPRLLRAMVMRVGALADEAQLKLQRILETP